HHLAESRIQPDPTRAPGLLLGASHDLPPGRFAARGRTSFQRRLRAPNDVAGLDVRLDFHGILLSAVSAPPSRYTQLFWNWCAKVVWARLFPVIRGLFPPLF